MNTKTIIVLVLTILLCRRLPVYATTGNPGEKGGDLQGETMSIYNEIYPEVFDFTTEENLNKWINVSNFEQLYELSSAIQLESNFYTYKEIGPERDIYDFSLKTNLVPKHFYYNIDGIDHIAEENIPFKSEEMIDLIPENCRDYFIKAKVLGKTQANDYGIYGLLSEYNAYSKGFEFLSNCLTDESIVAKYKNFDLIFSEIELSILSYLMYAKNYYPEEYKELCNSEELKNVYIKIKDNINSTKLEIKDNHLIDDTKLPTRELLSSDIFRETENVFLKSN